MRIVVLMKQVVNSGQVVFRPDENTGTYMLVRNPAESIMNYDDGNALEIALRWKDQNPDTHITVISMGPPEAEGMLRECLAIGADRAILVTDERIRGADTVATANYLACSIKKIGEYDLILAGYQSQDGRTGQIGPMVAEKLGIPQITYVRRFYEEAGRLIGIKELDGMVEKTAIEMPCVVVISKQKYCLRGMTLSAIRKALKKEICIWNLEDICGNEEREAVCLPRTVAVKVDQVEKKRKNKIVKFEDCQNGILADIIREIRKLNG